MSSARSPETPYVGLRPFQHDEGHLFFGRHEHTVKLLELLHRTHFLVVAGSSGCGKSSLVRAGLIPALLGGFLVADREQWQFAAMKPGDGPFAGLARALCEMEVRQDGGHRQADDDRVRALRDSIRKDLAHAVLKQARAGLGQAGNLLLLVDQMEEIFSFRGEEDDEKLTPEDRRHRQRCRSEAADFVDILLEVAEKCEEHVFVVLTMRSDFLGACDVFEGLPEAVNRSLYLVPRLTRDELREAIAGPARRQGVEIAPRLLDRLLLDLGDGTDQLPVLQHALLQTWEEWRQQGSQGPVDLTHYEKIGTLERALSQDGDRALQAVDRKVTARIFKRLADTDPYGRRVRRSATIRELAQVSNSDVATVDRILDEFGQEGRNFVLKRPASTPADRLVNISHESLIRQWETLRRWVDEERKARDEFLDLFRRARKREAGDGDLLQGLDLARTRQFWKITRPSRAWTQTYCKGSHDFETVQQYYRESLTTDRKSARRRERAIMAAVAVLLLIFTVWALYNKVKAEENAMRAEDLLRVSVANEWLHKDPTTAALVLLEVKQPEETTYATSKMREVLDQKLAEVELRGHEDRVLTASFSPDGAWVVTASRDGTARVWLWTSADEPIVLEGHDGSVLAASFSPDGNRVVTASEDGTARVWPWTSSVDPVVLQGHAGSVNRAAFSPDGSRVVTASSDGTARVWALASLGEPLVLEGHAGSLWAAAFSPDGSRVVTASSDGTARVWSLASPSDPVILQGHEGIVWAAGFSPDGGRVVTASSDSTARVWSLAPPRDPLILKGHDGRVWSASFSPDGTQVATASDDGTARVWSLASPSNPVILKGHGGSVWTAAFSPDGRRVVTASEDDTARVWSLTPPADPVILDEDAGRVLAVSVSSDGGTLLSAPPDGTARVRAPASPSDIAVLDGHTGIVKTAAFSADGSRVVTADGTTARVWSLASPSDPILLPGHDGSVCVAAFSPDGSRVVTGSEGRTARVWTLNSLAEPEVLAGHEDSVCAAAFSSDGKRVVTGSEDGTARIWTLASQVEPVILAGHQGSASAVAFSPDGKRVVTGAEDGTVRVWSPGSAVEPVLLEGHTRRIYSVSFSPHRTQVATASSDGTVRVWSWPPPSRNPLVLAGHSGTVKLATFATNGDQLITVTDGGTVRMWSISAEGLRQAIRKTTTICLTPQFCEEYLGEWTARSRVDDRCERKPSDPSESLQ